MTVSLNDACLAYRLILGHRGAGGPLMREVTRTDRAANHGARAIVLLLQAVLFQAYCGEVSVEKAEDPSRSRVVRRRVATFDLWHQHCHQDKMPQRQRDQRGEPEPTCKFECLVCMHSRLIVPTQCEKYVAMLARAAAMPGTVGEEFSAR